jgi:putative DNA-binding protein
MFAPFASSFARALLDVEQPIPLGINAPGATAPTRRFAVHRNNMVAGLVKVLRGRFPVVEKIVGEEFFKAMAHAFVVEHPPRSPLLTSYGDDFAGFITGFAPARQLAYLADVARVEAARTRAYRAADVSPVDPGRFAAVAAGAVDAIRFEMHPSVEIIRSPHPIVTIWAMNSGEQTLVPIEHWSREDALVARPYLDVEIRCLPPGGAAFLLALSNGRPLGEAAQDAFADAPDFDLASNIAGLIGWGVVTRISVSELTGDGSP